MICRICGEDINEKGQDNVSPISGYPICEDCKDDICCDSCYASRGDLHYVEEFDKVLCKSCLIEKAEKAGYINSSKIFYNEDWNRIGDDTDYEPIFEYLAERMDIQACENNG